MPSGIRTLSEYIFASIYIFHYKYPTEYINWTASSNEVEKSPVLLFPCFDDYNFLLLICVNFAFMLLPLTLSYFLASNCLEAHLQRWHMAALHKKRDKWYATFLPFFRLFGSRLNIVHQMCRFRALVISNSFCSF